MHFSASLELCLIFTAQLSAQWLPSSVVPPSEYVSILQPGRVGAGFNKFAVISVNKARRGVCLEKPLDNIRLSNDTCVICFCLHRVIEKICRAHSGRHGAAALHKVNLLVFASALLRWPSKDRKIPQFHLGAY